ncbi:MAG: hypothetical protein AMXMBFR7_46820 [Planctomycetota bacterium]
MLEFGCGYGTFTLPAARRVQGRVYALDIEPEMTAATAAKAREAGLANVVTDVRDFLAQGSGRPDRSIDYAMLFNILHIERPATLLNEAYRALKPGGKLGIIHWRRDRPTPRGPSLEIRPTLEQCRAWAEAAGFEFVRSEELCCCSWHWGLVMRRPLSASAK